MSLATSSGGAGAGAGMSMAAMAHGGPSALSTHQQTANANAAGGPPPGSGAGTAAAPNVAALAADLVDKNQNLGWKMVKNLAKMPIVSVDLYGDTGEVAYFPPKNEGEESNIEIMASKGEIGVKALGKVQSSGTSLALKKNDDAAHKALRRLITKAKGYEAVFSDTLTAKDDADSLVIRSPHLLLGERQIKYLPSVSKDKYTVGKESSHAIDEDDLQGITIRNGNLDGSSSAQQNNFDRVTLHLNMHSGKKGLTILPEEAVGIVLAKAKYEVSKHYPDLVKGDEKEKYMDFPPAIALPAWACNHYAIDSLMEACDGTAVLYNRSVAALSGALVPSFVKDKKANKISLQTSNLYNVITKRFENHQKKIQEAQKLKKPLPNTSYMPLVVMAGMTEDGIEFSAVQIKDVNGSFGRTDCHVPFGSLKVVSTVSYQHLKPSSIVNKSLVELSDIVDEICPELEDDGGVAAIVTYGTVASQLQLKDAILKSLNGIEGDNVWNTKIEFLSTREEAVSTGTCVLAGVSHNRIEPEIVESGKGKRPAVCVTNVAPCAVGITYNFDGGKKGSTWTEPKVVFDYDRRVPAGPYNVEFSAAECVALKKDPTLLNDMEKLVEESEQWLKGKHNALREEAALGLTIKVVQRFERNGKWRDHGFAANPLTQGGDDDETEEDGGEGSEKQAIETSTLELSLDSVGYLATQLSSDG